MFDVARPQYESQLREIREAGLYKSERVLAGPQNPLIDLRGKKSVLNMCANNYLGLADHPDVVAAARLVWRPDGLVTAMLTPQAGSR